MALYHVFRSCKYYSNEKQSFESALFDPPQKNSIAEMIEKTASRAQSRQRRSGACIPLCCCKAVPSNSLGIVLRNTSTCLKREAQVELTACTPLCCCKAV
jgi:hypothetical protein